MLATKRKRNQLLLRHLLRHRNLKVNDALETEDAFEAIAEDRIDREKGIIRGVKLLGIRSKNKRDYDTPGVRLSAQKLLAGAAIYIDHPKTATDARSYKDKFGVVGKEVKYVPGQGHFGDIHFNPKNQVAEQFIWDVLFAPNTFGMSINSAVKYADDGRRNKTGDQVVESIEVLRSLDVVTRPGTTDGIFESEEDEIMDLKTLREKHPELVTELLKDNSKSVTEQAELDAAKKEAADLKVRLDALESANAAAKLKTEVTKEITDALEGVELESELLGEIVECACEMKAENRKKFAGVLAKLSPMLAESPEEEELEVDDEVVIKEELEEKKAPSYVPTRKNKESKSAAGYDIYKSLGLKVS